MLYSGILDKNSRRLYEKTNMFGINMSKKIHVKFVTITAVLVFVKWGNLQFFISNIYIFVCLFSDLKCVEPDTCLFITHIIT